MNRLFFLLALFLLGACHSVTKTENVKKDGADYLLEDQGITHLLDQNHLKIKNIHGDFESFKKYLKDLNTDSLVSIGYALDYINTCLVHDTITRDSVFFLFNQKFNTIVQSLNDSLDSRYQPLESQMDKDSVTETLTAFRKNLEACGVGIFTSEGFYYLDVIHDFFYNNFKNRVSAGLKEYLNIRKDEMKEGFSEDAGMLISFSDLYKRIKRWEHYVNAYPQNLFREDANNLYITYLETLFTGMDNTPAFDFESNTLLPEVKTIMESAMKDEPDSPTSCMITDYYSFLSRHEFKNNDSIPKFMETHKMSSMMAVQPNTR